MSMPIVNVDWDGTAVPDRWPEQPTTFCPGFVRNMLRLHRAGVHVRVHTSRILPYVAGTAYPGGTFDRADPAFVAAQLRYIRGMLDRAGLTFVDIWTGEGKAPGDAYVDDKGERYTGSKGAWDKTVDRILLRLGRYDQEVAR